MNNQITNILLGVIAVTLMVNTYYTASNSGSSSKVAKPISNVAAKPVLNNAVNAQLPEPAKPKLPPTTIVFEEMDYDFGKIDQNTENKKMFKFTNTGKEALVIENAKGSCGCTVPKYPKKPIQPGETGEIEVVYKPGKQKGVQNKTVTLTANTEPSNTILKIKADVQEVADATPVK